jgi:putative ABC transport system permease protein
VFGMQRNINDYRQEPLTAILPGVALAELWQTIGVGEKVLGLISVLVMMASLLGLATMLLASMRERQREIALYRALGAHALTIVVLIELESLLITVFGVGAGFLLVYLLLLGGQGRLMEEYGLSIEALPMNSNIAWFMLAIIAASLVLALIPSLSAYRNSLAEKLRFSN